ncbi:hypothetical protein C5167_001374 [Papaver somniferum]|uniref:Uncharacterized protein n=1 Tax=Papaver somniferum TaxID=3469 RepID=A0A4Y7KXX2_PAPSO|nr:hypothetical protein C5167_001374 [Papaver somniferum]
MARQPARTWTTTTTTNYNAMIIHALNTLEQYNPHGSTIAQVAHQIRLLYGNSPGSQTRLLFDNLPDSHALQVETELEKMVRRRYAKTRGGGGY